MAISLTRATTNAGLTIGGTSKSSRVTLYDAFGREVCPAVCNIAYGMRGFTSATFQPAATPTDCFVLVGSPTKTVFVTGFYLSTLQVTNAGINRWFLLKRSSLNAGGTFTYSTAIASDSNDPQPSTALLMQYTANPTTVGNLVGTVWAGSVAAPLLATVSIGDTPSFTGINVNFTERFGKPLVLRGPTQCLALNRASAAIANGGTVLTCLAGFSWYEV